MEMKVTEGKVRNASTKPGLDDPLTDHMKTKAEIARKAGSRVSICVFSSSLIQSKHLS